LKSPEADLDTSTDCGPSSGSAQQKFEQPVAVLRCERTNLGGKPFDRCKLSLAGANIRVLRRKSLLGKGFILTVLTFGTQRSPKSSSSARVIDTPIRR
jgi:hypothetical protein